jgi:hypothetical protein
MLINSLHSFGELILIFLWYVSRQIFSPFSSFIYLFIRMLFERLTLSHQPIQLSRILSQFISGINQGLNQKSFFTIVVFKNLKTPSYIILGPNEYVFTFAVFKIVKLNFCLLLACRKNFHISSDRFTSLTSVFTNQLRIKTIKYFPSGKHHIVLRTR